MNSVLLHPTYFPCIAQMSAITQAGKVVFEIEDNYQKQTYRNRCYIAHSNGRLSLNVPVKHSKNGQRQKTREVCTEDSFQWQELHWKSLQSAYRTSPYFEFYEDALEPLFERKATHLLEHNLFIFDVLVQILELEVEINCTEEYMKNPEQRDLRRMVEAKNEPNYKLEPYTQVFQSTHGYLPNLSVLDLLFNEGPNTADYLIRQKLEL